MKTPFQRYRPVKVSDGEGGFTKSLGEAVVLYGNLEVQDEGVLITGVDAREDVRVEDIVRVTNE